MSETFFTYKGRPLVRKGDNVYYGNMNDPYVIMMQIHSKKMDGDLEVADKISMQMISTDLNVPPEKLVLRQNIREAAEALNASGGEAVYVVTCLSARDKVLSETEVLA